MTARTRDARGWGTALLALSLAGVVTAKDIGHRPGAPFGDFGHLSTGAECLLDGCDPYDAAALNREAAARHEPKPEVWAQAPVYPPSSLMVAMPFARLGWPAAPIAFNYLSGFGFAVASALLVWRLRVGAQPAAVILFTLLVCNPIRAAFQFANPALLCTALAAMGCVTLLREEHEPQARSNWLAWSLLGIALALKPQLVLGAVVVLVLNRATRRAAWSAIAISLLLLLAGCAAYRWRLGSFHFLAQLNANVKLSLVPGSTSDFSSANDESFDFLNVQTIYSRLPHVGRRLAEALGWITTAALALATWLAAKKTHALEQRPWTLVALVSLIGLMPVYHRGYDRVIALLLVPAAVEIGRRSRRLAWVYALAACLWVSNDTVMSHVLRRWRFKPQNPAEELVLCALLLASLLVASKGDAAAFDAGEVRKEGGRTHRRGAGQARRRDRGGPALSSALPL